jgi:hypothetical protein
MGLRHDEANEKVRVARRRSRAGLPQKRSSGIHRNSIGVWPERARSHAELERVIHNDVDALSWKNIIYYNTA